MLSRLLPTPSDYPQEHAASLRENIRMHLLDGSLYVLGMSIVSFQTILPIFIKELGGSPLSIGSIQVLWTIGQNLPSLIIAHYIQRRVLFKPAMISWGLAHRLMLLVCSIAAYFLVGSISPDVAVPLFLLFIFLLPAIGSFSGLPWFQVYTKTIPVKMRGRLMGIRQLLGSAGGALGGTIVAIVLATISFPGNFALLFLCAFIVTMASFYFLTRISEQPSVPVRSDLQQLNIIANAKRIIRTDRNYRNFLFADVFLLMSLTASSFYSVYAIEKFALPPSYAGTFTAIIMITNIAANIVFGIVGDSYGHKVNLLFFAVCSAGAGLFAIISTNILMYGFVFIFFACAVQLQAISRQSFLAEMCNEQDRPLYVGITNTFTAPAVMFGLLFGWLVPMLGYASVFFITTLLAAISFLILYRFVIEPRNNH
ncbi:MAG: MFS transporter [Bacteroidota bacterium]